jgi:hypothetical protein
MVSTDSAVYTEELGDHITHHHPYCEQQDPHKELKHVIPLVPAHVPSLLILLGEPHKPYADWQPVPQ